MTARTLAATRTRIVDILENARGSALGTYAANIALPSGFVIPLPYKRSIRDLSEGSPNMGIASDRTYQMTFRSIKNTSDRYAYVGKEIVYFEMRLDIIYLYDVSSSLLRLVGSETDSVNTYVAAHDRANNDVLSVMQVFDEPEIIGNDTNLIQINLLSHSNEDFSENRVLSTSVWSVQIYTDKSTDTRP